MKFLYLFTIILLLCTLSGFSQEEQKPVKPKFALGVNFSPAYAYRFIWISKDASTFTQSFKELLDDCETGKFGYTTGLNFSWFALKRLTVESGIWFSDKGFDMKIINLVTATGDPILIGNARVRYTMGYLSVPLK